MLERSCERNFRAMWRRYRLKRFGLPIRYMSEMQIGFRATVWKNEMQEAAKEVL
jgi:hypothetical protein